MPCFPCPKRSGKNPIRKDRKMIKNILLAATMLLSILGLSFSLSAHHSAAAQFDVTQEFVLTGVLTELQEVNPHSIWHVDVKGEDGKVTSRRAIVSKNSRFFVAAGIAIVIGAAGRVTPASPQTTPYQPPAKRVSPAEGFARQKSSLPTPRAADGHPDLTGIWTGGFPSPAGAYTVRRMGTFEPDQSVMQRGAAWSKPIYK